MAVITLKVPSIAQMGYGLGKAIQYGVEYEIISDSIIELSSGDNMRLAKMMVAFQGELIGSSTQKNVQVDLPRTY